MDTFHKYKSKQNVQSNIVRGSQKALGAHISPEFPGDCYYYFKKKKEKKKKIHRISVLSVIFVLEKASHRL